MQKVMNSKVPTTVATGFGSIVALVLPGVQMETRAIIVAGLIAVYKVAEGYRERGSKGELAYLTNRFEELTKEN